MAQAVPGVESRKLYTSSNLLIVRDAFWFDVHSKWEDIGIESLSF